MPIIEKNITSEKDTNKKQIYCCDYCGKAFIKLKSRVIGKHVFCSKDCYRKWRNSDMNPKYTSKEMICEYCGKAFISPAARYKVNKHNYCSKYCANKDKGNTYTDEYKKEIGLRIIKHLNKGTFSNINTAPQKSINNLLNRMNILYTNEYTVGSFSIDNYLNEYELFIEVMGTFWHTDPTKYTEIKYEQQLRGCKRDIKKREYIKDKYNVGVLSIWEKDINNNIEKCEKLITYYINNNGIINNYNSFNYSIDDGVLKLNQNIILPFYERNESFEYVV